MKGSRHTVELVSQLSDEELDEQVAYWRWERSFETLHGGGASYARGRLDRLIAKGAAEQAKRERAAHRHAVARFGVHQ